MSMTRRGFCRTLGAGGILSQAPLRRRTARRPDADARRPPRTARTSATCIHSCNSRPIDRGWNCLSCSPRFAISRHGRRRRAPECSTSCSTLRRRVASGGGHSPHRPGRLYRGVLTFQTTPDLRVPGYVLIPKKATLPAPGLVVLHCHGGAYVWGKEKVVAVENEAGLAVGVQAATLRRNEHRERAGAPRLRGHHHRHVLLGRAAHAAGRRILRRIASRRG